MRKILLHLIWPGGCYKTPWGKHPPWQFRFPTMYTTADKPGTLLRATRALLGKDRRSLHAISVGSGVPFYWLRKFATGEIRSPSVNRVQRLYEYLANSKVLP